MIQANELRIGNLVFRDELNIENGKWDELTIKINYQDIFNLINGNNIVKTAYNPIPLTEEWLVKFGFEKPSVCGSYVILYLNDENKPSSLQIPLFRKDVIQICRSGICAYEAKCKYVHELQNLYFAITGEELTITH